MTRTVFLVVSIVSLAACGRSDPVEQEHAGSAATMLRATPDSVAGGSNHYNVWPTGDPGLDVSNVQWAVDHANAGGVVSLKATNKFTGVPMAFEFGTEGSVEVTTQAGSVVDKNGALSSLKGLAGLDSTCREIFGGDRPNADIYCK